MKADLRVVLVSGGLAALALGVVFLLRETLATAPQAVFPLILLIVVGGAMVWAWTRKRRDRA